MALLDDLVALTGSESVDLMILDDSEPIARFNGLVGTRPLFEDSPGRWGSVQMAAAGAVFDTEWLRREEWPSARTRTPPAPPEPRLAAVRNLAIGAIRLTGTARITETMNWAGNKTDRPLQLLHLY